MPFCAVRPLLLLFPLLYPRKLTARFVLSAFPRIEENPLTLSTHWRTSARASNVECPYFRLECP